MIHNPHISRALADERRRDLLAEAERAAAARDAAREEVHDAVEAVRRSPLFRARLLRRAVAWARAH